MVEFRDPRIDMKVLFLGCHMYLDQLVCQMRGCLWERGRCVDSISTTTTDPTIAIVEDPAGMGEEGEEEKSFIPICKFLGFQIFLFILERL